MTTVLFGGKSYTLKENETMLEGLLRQGVDYPHACKSGTCQTCLSKANKGDVDPAWQHGLKDSQCSQHYFFPCMAKPKKDMAIALPGFGESSVEAKIIDKISLSSDIISLHLGVDDLSLWTPGQYINLINSNGLIRSYSIANLPEIDGYIELQIKLFEEGKMSQWIQSANLSKKAVFLRGPIGDCFYLESDDKIFDIVLAGTGTGLAPLIGIARSALSKGHKGHIHLIHGALIAEDLYADNLLKALADQHENFTYEACVLNKSDAYTEDLKLENIQSVLLSALTNPSSTRCYICGASDTVRLLKTKAFLAGVSAKNIYSDIFLVHGA